MALAEATAHPFKADAVDPDLCAQCGDNEPADQHDMATQGDAPPNTPKPMSLKMAFVEWLFTAGSEREHKTMTAWAEAHGVSRQTLWEWRNGDPDVLAAIKEWRRVGEAAWPGVFSTLVKVATDEGHPAVVQAGRTVAELMDKYPDKRVRMDLNINVTSVYAEAAEAIEGEFTEHEALPEQPGE